MQQQNSRVMQDQMVGPGLVEMYALRRRDMVKLLLAACTVAIGVSLFWFFKRVWKDAVFPEGTRDQWTTTQAVMAHASLPMALIVATWTLKVFAAAPRTSA